jgi:hypothetical protein
VRELFEEFHATPADDLVRAFKSFRRKWKWFPKISEIYQELAAAIPPYQACRKCGCSREGWIVTVTESAGRDVWRRCQCWEDYAREYGLERHAEDNRERRRHSES